MSESQTRKRPLPRLAIGVLLVGIAVLAIIPFHPVRGMTNPNDPGPWLLPRLLAGLLILGGVLLFTKHHRPASHHPSKRNPRDTSRLMLVTGIAAYLMAMQWVGFLVATPVFASVMLIGSGIRWLTAIVTGAAVTLVAYGVFAQLLKVPLPEWFWS